MWDPGKVTSSELYFPHLLNGNCNIPSSPEQWGQQAAIGSPAGSSSQRCSSRVLGLSRVGFGPRCALRGGGHGNHQTQAALSLLYLALLCLPLKWVKWWHLKDMSTQDLRFSLFGIRVFADVVKVRTPKVFLN